MPHIEKICGDPGLRHQSWFLGSKEPGLQAPIRDAGTKGGGATTGFYRPLLSGITHLEYVSASVKK